MNPKWLFGEDCPCFGFARHRAFLEGGGFTMQTAVATLPVCAFLGMLLAALGIPMNAQTARLSADGLQLAERGGFEPPVQFNPYGSLANYWFKPLTHLSELGGKYSRLVQTAIPEGFEPSTACLEGRCSIQLSYGIGCCLFHCTIYPGWKRFAVCALHAGRMGHGAKLRK